MGMSFYYDMSICMYVLQFVHHLEGSTRCCHILSWAPYESCLLLDFRPYAAKPSIFRRGGAVTLTTESLLVTLTTERGNHGSYYPTVNHGSNYPSQWEAFEW